MRLVQLYSNRENEFTPVRFNEFFSAVVAEIRLPENLNVDVHNLGKTLFGELIDFCLLKEKRADFFLFSEPQFSNFVFFLEVRLTSGEFLTIKRPVDPGTRVSMLISERSVDASSLEDESWDHVDLSFERSLLALDGFLKLDSLQPWRFRKIGGYLLRSQADYSDVFKLGKFAGKHRDWKPFVAHLLGLDSEAVQSMYDAREDLESAKNHLASLVREWGDDVEDPSRLDGLISVKRREVEQTEAVVDSFDFSKEDRRVTAVTIDDIESRIALANEERYRLAQLIQRLDQSLTQERILFKPSDSEKLFREAGVVLGDQLRYDYDQLIAFNREIGIERQDALRAQRDQAKTRHDQLEGELRSLGAKQAEALSFLRSSEALGKYKDITRALTEQRTALDSLERQREAAARLADLRRERRQLEERLGSLETAVEHSIEEASGSDESKFGQLRQYFDEIIYEVVGKHALVTVHTNNSHGLEFAADIVGDAGDATNEGHGTTYQKLLCVAFDLAMLRTFLDQPFPRFVFHDGAFEQLEPRKQAALLGVLRRYAGLGVQPVVTALDSDLPMPDTDAAVTEDEIILQLHDDGESGRLFKMPSW